MHSFLIIGGTKQLRMSQIDIMLKDKEVSAFDRIVLKSEDGAIGVAQVREFTKKLSLAPFQGKTIAGMIEDANLLTIEAQNALLKTLEEPSPKAIIIVETVQSDLLLPTIVSRCQVISLGTGEQYPDDELMKITDEIKKIEEARIGERIKMIDTIATDREAAKAWVEKAIFASREALLQEYFHTRGGIDKPPKDTIPPIQNVKLLRHLLQAQKQLSANVTPKLILDAIFLDSTPQ